MAKKSGGTLSATSRQLKTTVKLPSVWLLTRETAYILWQHKKLFFGITLVYGLLNLVLVQSSVGSTDISSVKDALSQAAHGHFGNLAVGLGVFASLLSSGSNSSNTGASAYQLILFIIASLAVIWALRQLLGGFKVGVKDAYYQGMYPFVPFVLVLAVIGLELIPLLVGSALYQIVVGNGIAVHPVERLFWALLYFVLAVLSLYMISSSVFALYIVTLQDMAPVKALRSARDLVRGRRWAVLRKILYLPLLMLVAASIIMLPVILWLTALAQWVFFVLTMLALVAAHTYLYALYRELLNE